MKVREGFVSLSAVWGRPVELTSRWLACGLG